MELRRIPPVMFNKILGIPASTRRFLFSDRFEVPLFVHAVTYSFRAGNLDTLELRFWMTQIQALADDAKPSGMPLLGTYGADDYVSGENMFNFRIPIERSFPSGLRFMVDANNTDSNPHSAICYFDVSEVRS